MDMPPIEVKYVWLAKKLLVKNKKLITHSKVQVNQLGKSQISISEGVLKCWYNSVAMSYYSIGQLMSMHHTLLRHMIQVPGIILVFGYTPLVSMACWYMLFMHFYCT